eukprot:13741063-Ditylum_brightwellii.AAC.1
MTGRHYNTIRGVEEFELSESAYADNAVFLFSSRAAAEQETPRVYQHCTDWGMGVHSGTATTSITKGKVSKSKILFIAKPSSSYTDPSAYDNTDLSPVLYHHKGPKRWS